MIISVCLLVTFSRFLHCLLCVCVILFTCVMFLCVFCVQNGSSVAAGKSCLAVGRDGQTRGYHT